MFIELVESNRKTSRSSASAIASVTLHTGLIAVAIVATANARTTSEQPIKDPVVVYIPQRAPNISARSVAQPVKPLVKQREMVAPTVPISASLPVATELPGITALPAVSEGTPSSSAINSLTSDGTAGPAGDGVTGPLTAFEVDKAVRPFRTNRQPTYPDILRAQGVEGEVLARYVVSESGRVDMRTFEVISASSPSFATAVRTALERARFEPAEAAGKKVAQLVEQRFQFRLN